MKYLKCTFACCVWLYWYAKECSVRGGRWWRCCGKGWYRKRLVKGNKRMKGEYLVISWTVYHLINVWPSNWKIGNRNNTKKEKLLFLMSSLPPSLAYTLTFCIFHFLSLDIFPLANVHVLRLAIFLVEYAGSFKRGSWFQISAES